jgi:hypothetical protein
LPKRVTEHLTEDLFRRLCGVEAWARASHAVMLCTVDADGRPRPSMLSYFEVAARDRHNLRLAVYNDSRTCANLRERGQATLVVIDAGLVCYVTGTVDALVPTMREASYNAKLNLRIDQVVFDEASPDLEPGADVTSGIIVRSRTAESLARATCVLAELLEP